MGAVVYAGCPSDKPLRFSCGDFTGVKYTSNQFPSMNLLSGECTNFRGGSNNPYRGDYILAIDDSNPSCGQFNVDYDIYMHFGIQWGCKGISNTNQKSGWWFSVSYKTGRNPCLI